MHIEDLLLGEQMIYLLKQEVETVTMIILGD